MGLGSGRRGMKSPPLLIAVLLACVFVLGINYWITSSRCMELQSHVVELESRMRRAAAERGAVEMKKNEFEEKLAKQKEQIDTIQSLHTSQMQSLNLMYKSEKESLLNNITMKEKLIQSLQGQIKNLHKEFDELQESQAKKSIFELAQCSNKMKEQIEQCEERLRRATGKGVQPKPTISKQVTEQKDNSVKEETKQLEDNVIHDISKPSESPPKAELVNKEEETNEVQENVDQTEKKTTPELLLAKQKEEKKVEDAPQSEKTANEDLLENKVEEDEEQIPELATSLNKEAENEEVEREHLLDDDQIEDKDGNQGEQNEEQVGQNDYNGDEGNEAEPEAEKQAQLIDNDQNLKVDTALKGPLLDDGEDNGEDNGDPTLKK